MNSRSSMSELTKLRRQLPPMLRALAVGIPAGFLFDYLHTIGPRIAVAAFNLMGVRMYSSALRSANGPR